jgi:hypothetical protein
MAHEVIICDTCEDMYVSYVFNRLHKFTQMFFAIFCFKHISLIA